MRAYLWRVWPEDGKPRTFASPSKAASYYNKLTRQGNWARVKRVPITVLMYSEAACHMRRPRRKK